MKIENFEDLECWKIARELVKEVYKISKCKLFCRDFALRDQIRRAAISAMSNIAEGFASLSQVEFRRFLDIAIRSTSEVRSQCYIAFDQEYISAEEFKGVQMLAERTQQLTKGMARYLRGNIRLHSCTSTRLNAFNKTGGNL